MDQNQLWWRGDRLKTLRKERDSTQQEIARLLATDQSLYARFENQRAAPTIEVAVRIAKEFQVSLDWLVGISDERSSQIHGAGLAEGEVAILVALRHRDIEKLMRHVLAELDRMNQTEDEQREKSMSPNDG